MHALSAANNYYNLERERKKKKKKKTERARDRHKTRFQTCRLAAHM